MKLTCTVEVNNRTMAGLATAGGIRRRGQKSCLAIGQNLGKDKGVYMLLQTAQNKQGTRYKVENNVETVFTNFIDSGKATIRLKEPPHDLIIQSDSLQLKSFFHILKLGLSKKSHPAIVGLSNLSPKAFAAPPKTKVVIRSSSEYPTLKGFPRTTENLVLAGLERKSFDRQILKLQKLRILDLSSNRLTNLPKELGELPNLQELYVADNLLGRESLSRWSWLNGRAFSRNLRLLDISGNEIGVLPPQIGKLFGLVTLKVGKNQLTLLPQSIGGLWKLKYLDLSDNKLNELPGGLRNLNLDAIDISNNPFLFEPIGDIPFTVPTLVEISGRAFLSLRRPYDPSEIPATLVKFLDEAHYCPCGRACFSCHHRIIMRFSVGLIACSVKSSGNCFVPFDCYFCSSKCIRRYYRRHEE